MMFFMVFALSFIIVTTALINVFQKLILRITNIIKTSKVFVAAQIIKEDNTRNTNNNDNKVSSVNILASSQIS